MLERHCVSDSLSHSFSEMRIAPGKIDVVDDDASPQKKRPRMEKRPKRASGGNTDVVDDARGSEELSEGTIASTMEYVALFYSRRFSNSNESSTDKQRRRRNGYAGSRR